MFKSSKRDRAGTNSYANADRSTDSSVIQSPAQEGPEPHFSNFYTEAFEHPSLASPSRDNAFLYMGVDEFGKYFEENYVPLDSGSVGSSGSDLTVNLESLWDSL